MAARRSRLRARRGWLLLVATLPLLVTLPFLGAYALYALDGTVVYWLMTLDDYTAFGLAPLVGGLGLALLFLVIIYVFLVAMERVAARSGRAIPYGLGAMGLLFLLGLLGSCAALLNVLSAAEGDAVQGVVPLFAGVIVAILLMFAILALPVVRPGQVKLDALGAASFLLICLLCSGGSLLLFRDSFATTHLESLHRGQLVYHLAYKPTMGWSFVFVAYECDSTGMLCHARTQICAVHEGDSADPIRPDARMRVDAATGAVSIQVAGNRAVACWSPLTYPS